jgi:hypothetical protein
MSRGQWIKSILRNGIRQREDKTLELMGSELRMEATILSTSNAVVRGCEIELPWVLHDFPWAAAISAENDIPLRAQYREKSSSNFTGMQAQ